MFSRHIYGKYSIYFPSSGSGLLQNKLSLLNKILSVISFTTGWTAVEITVLGSNDGEQWNKIAEIEDDGKGGASYTTPTCLDEREGDMPPPFHK